MGGGARPFLIGRVIRLVSSVNERSLSLLNSANYDSYLMPSEEDFCVSDVKKFQAITGL